MRVKALLFILALVLAAGCAPVYIDPFDDREGGGKSKILHAPETIALADGSVSILCVGRPVSIRILDTQGKVLGFVAVEDVVATPDGWRATFPLFDGMQAFFKPGDRYRIQCFGANGTDGSYITVSVFYFRSD